MEGVEWVCVVPIVPDELPFPFGMGIHPRADDDLDGMYSDRDRSLSESQYLTLCQSESDRDRSLHFPAVSAREPAVRSAALKSSGCLHIHMYYICIYVIHNTYIYIYIYNISNISLSLSLYIYIYIYTYLYIYIYIYIHTYVCVYIYIYTHNNV